MCLTSRDRETFRTVPTDTYRYAMSLQMSPRRLLAEIYRVYDKINSCYKRMVKFAGEDTFSQMIRWRDKWYMLVENMDPVLQFDREAEEIDDIILEAENLYWEEVRATAALVAKAAAACVAQPVAATVMVVEGCRTDGPRGETLYGMTTMEEGEATPAPVEEEKHIASNVTTPPTDGEEGMNPAPAEKCAGVRMTDQTGLGGEQLVSLLANKSSKTAIWMGKKRRTERGKSLMRMLSRQLGQRGIALCVKKRKWKRIVRVAARRRKKRVNRQRSSAKLLWNFRI